jgi:hypothetical protein
MLVTFAHKVLRWLPEERKSAAEFLEEDDNYLTQLHVPEVDGDDK